MDISDTNIPIPNYGDNVRLDYKENYEAGSAFTNGTYVPLSEAQIPILDSGFLGSDLVYDALPVISGKYFRLQDHLDRFSISCEKFRLRAPHPNETMVEIFDNLLRLAGLKLASVIWCVTRGLVLRASDRPKYEMFEPRFYAMALPYQSIATPEQRRRGLDIMISQTFIRIPSKAVDPTVKNFNGQDMRMAMFEGRDHNKDWSVLTDTGGYLTEGGGANIFIVKGGEIFTPDSDRPPLSGPV